MCILWFLIFGWKIHYMWRFLKILLHLAFFLHLRQHTSTIKYVTVPVLAKNIYIYITFWSYKIYRIESWHLIYFSLDADVQCKFFLQGFMKIRITKKFQIQCVSVKIIPFGKLITTFKWKTFSFYKLWIFVNIIIILSLNTVNRIVSCHGT